MTSERRAQSSAALFCRVGLALLVGAPIAACAGGDESSSGGAPCEQVLAVNATGATGSAGKLTAFAARFGSVGPV